jgi:hypothetical protein
MFMPTRRSADSPSMESSDVPGDRQARMKELLAQRRYLAALKTAAAQLGDLGVTLGRDDALTKEAVQSALDAVGDLERYHLIWHRVWGVMLRSEVIETTNQLASRLDGERAALVWGHSPAVGFLVDVPAALSALPAYVGPEPGEVGLGGIGSDLLLVADEGKSGLRLEYNHYAHADEYELRSWGRYAFSLVE